MPLTINQEQLKESYEIWRLTAQASLRKLAKDLHQKQQLYQRKFRDSGMSLAAPDQELLLQLVKQLGKEIAIEVGGDDLSSVVVDV